MQELLSGHEAHEVLNEGFFKLCLRFELKITGINSKFLITFLALYETYVTCHCERSVAIFAVFQR